MSFRHLSAAQRKEVASRGGKAAHKSGKAHKWTSQEAQQAVKKTRHYKKKND